MSFRALIIGIESYPQVQDGSIASELPGTLQAAFDFRDWLTQKWNNEGVPAAAQQILFCSSPIQPGGLGASYDAIMDALITLAATGQNATKELYVFFSGHGFSYVRPDGSSDILIASDFVKSTRSGNVCFNLDKVIDWLRMHLGPGRHYYFVDACRTALTSAQIVPGELTLPSNPQTSGEPSTYVLQSTGRGNAAAADNRFPEALLAGLKGKGKAKVWDDAAVDTMMVRYDLLCIFLRETFKPQKIYSTVKGSDFASDGVLAILKPAPTAKCTVKIDGGEDRQAATVNCIGRRNATPIKRQIAGREAEIELKPDRYTITIQMTEPLTTSAQHVELYDDITLTFQLSTAATPSFQDSTDETLSDIIIPQGVTVELQDSLTGTATEFRHSDRTSMPSGRYRATVRDNKNRVIGQKEYEIEGPAAAVINVADWRHSVPHMAIAKFLPQYDGGVDFSEALSGPVTDPDLDIWLAILGGGRILGARGDYSKIERFPLRDFSTETAGSSPTYVLAGFEEPSVDLEVGVSQGDAIVWHAATEPSAMSGIKECLCADQTRLAADFAAARRRPLLYDRFVRQSEPGDPDHRHAGPKPGIPNRTISSADGASCRRARHDGRYPAGIPKPIVGRRTPCATDARVPESSGHIQRSVRRRTRRASLRQMARSNIDGDGRLRTHSPRSDGIDGRGRPQYVGVLPRPTRHTCTHGAKERQARRLHWRAAVSRRVACIRGH